MEGGGQASLSKFTIPKKKPKVDDASDNMAETEPAPQAIFKPVHESHPNHTKMTTIVSSRISNQNKNFVQIRGLAEIENVFLRKKYEKYRVALLESKGKSIKEFFVFLACSSRSELEDIAKNGLRFQNSFYSDLGSNSKGVYVFRHPDYMVAHPFFKGQSVKGICFKFAAVSSLYFKVQRLDSPNLIPQMQHPAHCAYFDNTNSPKYRLEQYKADQLYVYDNLNEQSGEAPACLLPYFTFELEVSIKEIPLQLQDFIRPELYEHTLLEWKHCNGIFGSENLSINTFCEATKPYGLIHSEICFDHFVTLEAFHQHPAIEKLFQRKHWGKIASSVVSEIRLREEFETGECWHVLLSTLRGSSSKFKEIVHKMKKESLGVCYSFSIVQNCNEYSEIDIIGIYPCETTMRLGLPYLQDDSYIYCFIAKLGPQSLLDRPIENEMQESNKYAKITEESVTEAPRFSAILAEEFFQFEKKKAEEFELHNRLVKHGIDPAERGFNTQLSADDSAILSGEVESADGIEMDCGVYKEPLKGLIKRPSENPSRPRRSIRWASPVQQDYPPPTPPNMFNNTSTENRRLETSLSDAQKAEEEQRTFKMQQEQTKKNKELFQNAFGSKSNLDVNGSLAPFVLPNKLEAEKSRDVEKDRGFVSKISSLPLPDVSKIGNRATNAAASTSECNIVDMEVDSGSSTREEEPERIVVEPTEPSKETEETVEDPFNIDYDAMLLGSHTDLTIDADADTFVDAEAGKVDTEGDSAYRTQSKDAEPAPKAPRVSVDTSNAWLEMALKLTKPDGSDAEKNDREKETADTPASPEPPASPPHSLLCNPALSGIKDILGKLGKCPPTHIPYIQDVDLRPTANLPLVSAPKIIPLCQKVEFSVTNNQKIPSLMKPTLAAFQEDRDDVQAEPSKDKDERLESRNRDDRSRDRDDRDDRYRRNDDRDRDRRDGDRRDRDYDRRDVDYDRRRDRDYRRDDRSRNRERDRDRNRYRDRDDDRDKRRGNRDQKDSRWRHSEDIPLPSSNNNEAGKLGDEKWKMQRNPQEDIMVKVPSPVPREALLFSNPLSGLGISSGVLSMLKVKSEVPDRDASPPPPASPECGSDNAFPGTHDQPSKFIKTIPNKKIPSEEGEIADEEYANKTFPNRGAARAPIRIPPATSSNRAVMNPSGLPIPGVVINPQLARPPPINVVHPTSSYQQNARQPPPTVDQLYVGGRAPGTPGRGPIPQAAGSFNQPFQVRTADLPDVIIIIPDELILKQQHTPTQKLRELLDKLVQYNIAYPKKRAYIHMHDHIMSYLKEKTYERYPQIRALQQQCSEYLNILLEYEQKKVVRMQASHFCDKLVAGKPHEINCIGWIKSNAKLEGYLSSKLIYFTPIAEGTPLHHRLQQEGAKMANARSIINFETL